MNAFRALVLCCAALLLDTPLFAQAPVPGSPATPPGTVIPPAAPPPTGTTTPPAPTTLPLGTLNVTANERQFFQFGYVLARAAFAYAPLAKRAAALSQTPKSQQMTQLGAMAALVQRDRTLAENGFVRALSLMHNLNAPPAACAPLSQAIASLKRPLPLTGDARALAEVNPGAAQALAALTEFEKLSQVPEQPAIHRWLVSPAVAASGQVWYAEGLVAAIAHVAAMQQMPDLLPPVGDVATDLRGLRDWLSLRLPDAPTAEQSLLKQELNAFLHQSAAMPKHRPVSVAQLRALGEISQKVYDLLLNAPAAPPVAPRVTTPPVSPPATPPG